MAAPPVAPCEAAIVRLVDTHTHLTDRQFSGDLDDVLRRADGAGVVAMIVVGYDLDTSERAIALAHRFPHLWATAGIHPHHASSYDDAAHRRLEALSRDPKMVAIGECGLDFYRSLSPSGDQRHAFRQQLALAAERELPVVVHSRDAMDETLSVLAGTRLPRGGVMHCFDGTAVAAAGAARLGLYISCAGQLTYRRDRTLADAIVTVAPDRLLVETDCPYLAPAGHRGTRNEPAYVRLVAEAAARARGTTLERLAAETTANAATLFSLPLDALATQAPIRSPHQGRAA